MKITKTEARKLREKLREELSADVKHMVEWPHRQRERDLRAAARKARRVAQLERFARRKAARR
jgi:hypothetical protein